MNANIHVYQIFYDDESRRSLDPGFIPLDNRANPRPDWYEFWVMRSYLHANALEDDHWYGFLSPKFAQKALLDSAEALHIVEQSHDHADVILFSAAWDQIAYFLNPFEQGEFWHPGLLPLAQRFIEEIEIDLNLSTLVTHSLSAVLANYIVAKPPFWRNWLSLADLLFDKVEGGQGALAPGLRSATTYGAATRLAPMKTFIQERLATIVLARDRYRVGYADTSATYPLFKPLFPEHPEVRQRLRRCDALKQRYTATNDSSHLAEFRQLRATIPTNRPIRVPIWGKP